MKTPALLLAALLAAPLHAQKSPDDAGITALREGLIDSFRKGDIDRLVTYLDPEVVVTWQNGEMCHGPAEIRAFYARMITGDQAVVREVKSDPEVLGHHVYRDWAVSWGNLHDHFILNDGSDLPFNSTFTATVAKSGDRWLIQSFHVSTNTFDNPVLNTAVKKTALWTGTATGVAGLLFGWIIARLRSSRRAG